MVWRRPGAFGLTKIGVWAVDVRHSRARSRFLFKYVANASHNWTYGVGGQLGGYFSAKVEKCVQKQTFLDTFSGGAPGESKESPRRGSGDRPTGVLGEA